MRRKLLTGGVVLAVGLLVAGRLTSFSAEAGAAGNSSTFVVTGARLPGGEPVTMWVENGLIRSLTQGPQGGATVDGRGRWLAPSLIDSHVHLAYLPESALFFRNGVGVVVDLASPLAFLSALPSYPRVLASGPMVTVPGGYPLDSWGQDGYGLPCSTPQQAADAVEVLYTRGARVVKVPVDGGDGLSDGALMAVVSAAHARGMKVAAHALLKEDARRAAVAGVDVLAHTPLEPLGDGAALWKGRAVISTLSAFPGRGALLNLAALKKAGATVLYGTDFGNTREAGVSGEEILALLAAGLTGKEILAAATLAPASYWGFSGLGGLIPGQEASFLLLDEDPHSTPLALTRPRAVFQRGVLQKR